MCRSSIVLIAALVLASARPPAARSSEIVWQPQTPPVILGEVVEVNAHVLSVHATDGEIMPIEFDSRTVMSDGLAARTPVRIEFRLLDNGVHLAQRVTPIERGSFDWETYITRLDARPADEAMAAPLAGTGALRDGDTRFATAEGEPQAASANEASTAPGSESAANSPEAAADTAGSANERTRLPDTASAVPAVLAVGLVLLIGAGALWWGRRSAG